MSAAAACTEPAGPGRTGSLEDPARDAYNADGVDLTLIRGMLRKTPTERLQAVQDVIDLLSSVKRAGPR